MITMSLLHSSHMTTHTHVFLSPRRMACNATAGWASMQAAHDEEMVQKVHPGAPACSMLLHVDEEDMHGIWAVV